MTGHSVRPPRPGGVAVQPDTVEGQWLRSYLASRDIPYSPSALLSPARPRAPTSTSGRVARVSALRTDTLRLHAGYAPASFSPAEQIQNRIREIGAQIAADYPNGNIYLIGILKGACIFLSDLCRAIPVNTRIEFIGTASYGRGKTSSGEVKLPQGPRHFH